MVGLPPATVPVAHVPAANIAAWFSADDYPAEALRRNEQGRVQAALAINATGRVTGCTVRVSSGSRALDTATCRIAERRGRFRPARDVSGTAIAATVPLSIRWVLPGMGTPPEAAPPPAHRREHRAWYHRLFEAEHLLAVIAIMGAALSRHTRRLFGWGRFTDDGVEVWGDHIPLPLRKRHRYERWWRPAWVVAPIVALAALLAWLDW